MSSVASTKLPFERLRRNGGFSRDPRFSSLFVQPPENDRVEVERDPVAEAYRRGRIEGKAEAEAMAEERERELHSRREAIELAFARFDAASAAELRERLRQTVYALCEETVLPLALDGDGLAARIEKATEMLRRAQDERQVLLNPEDLALVEGKLPADLVVIPDPSVERGGLRIETEDGGIEDGPSQWRRILAEAFREC